MVTPGDIAVELGRTSLDARSVQYSQWSAWIDRAYRKIQRRASRLGVDYTSIDQASVDDVVTFMVRRMAIAPADGAQQVSEQFSTDDTSMQQSRQYRAAEGDPAVLDEWWDLLGLSEAPASSEWSGSLAYSRGSSC